MRKPEEIESDIEKLNNELKVSKKHYEYKLLCDDKWSDEMIGFFNIGKAKLILSELNKGSKLQIRHEGCGTFNVYMNPQRNRILIENEDGSDLESGVYNGFKNSSSVICYKSSINEDTIESFIIWKGGTWYKKIN